VARIAVTGGAGFIGAATVKYANENGHEAWRFDRADGNDVMGDLKDLKGADVIIHLAGMLGTAELFDEPEEAVRANVVGTLRILEFCERYDIGYVGITMPDSSWANVYQATKLCSMRLATAWHRNFGVRVCHVRAFNAYGPGQKHGPGHPQKFLPTFATKAWAGEPLPIWGNGQQTVDMVHVNDVARMLVEATTFHDDQIFDAGTGDSVAVVEVAKMVNGIASQAADNIEYLPMRAGEEPETDIRAKGEGWDLLDWKPELNLDLVKEAVHWYRPE
jgi:UDP-glucose 4-epimerase